MLLTGLVRRFPAASFSRGFASKVFVTQELTSVEWDATEQPRILVTGAKGQIGSELVPVLRTKVGANNVVASDIVKPLQEDIENGPFFYLDITDKNAIERIVTEQRIDFVLHFAVMLSARAEANPSLAMSVNETGLVNVLEVVKKHGLRLFAPSSASVFGDHAQMENTPDNSVKLPKSLYGIQKANLELLGSYYARKFKDDGVEFRCCRFPGVISSKVMPGGGTTDWAVEALFAAVNGEEYRCWMLPDIRMPFIAINDVIRAVTGQLFADGSKLHQSVYNIDGVSFSPVELEAAIKKYIPEFKMTYVEGDPRVEIARRWPSSLDASAAKRDWGWQSSYTLDSLVKEMLDKIAERAGRKGLAEVPALSTPELIRRRKQQRKF